MNAHQFSSNRLIAGANVLGAIEYDAERIAVHLRTFKQYLEA